MLLAAAVAVALAGCGSQSAGAQHPSMARSAPPSASSSTVPTASGTPSATPTATATPRATPTPPPDPMAGLSLDQRVGQLFMIGTPSTAASPGTLSDVAALHTGGVFLSGPTTAGVSAIAGVTARLRASDHDGVPLLISTDQEGGQVQVLRGPGFSDIPSADAQSDWSAALLRTDAARWARQLEAAGLDMDLAPVADVIATPQQAAANPPIGQLQREYGLGESAVLPHAQAFEQGMLSAGVVPVVKHFPGLGAVTANTDFSSGVTDTTTTSTSPSVSVFGALVGGGAPAVMVSSAVYAQIAPGGPAVFAPAVVTALLRQRLGFSGLIMTDDVSAARQLAAWTPADRAILAIEAGVDVVLVSASPQLAPQMIAAVVAKARADPAFATQVDAACEHVLQLKQRYLERR